VMSVVPRERGGAGSAITNTSRQVSVALGVAVLGSILARAYRTTLSPHLAALPPAVRATASQSIAATAAVAQLAGSGRRLLLAAADQSFVHAVRLTTVVSIGIAVAGAVLVATWMPARRAADPDAGPPACQARPAMAEE